MSLSWSPPSAFYRGNNGEFVPGKDSLSDTALQWGGGRSIRKGKTFPLLEKEIFLLYEKQMLLSLSP
jgi:hypothetical protein